MCKKGEHVAPDGAGSLVRRAFYNHVAPPALENQMSVIGIGVDLVECTRIQRSIDRFGDRFLHRVFTDGEIEYSMSMKFPARHLAARFAAKEAVSKAFGTGIGKAMGWRNIDIRKKESGEPFLVFSGPAKELAARRGVTSALITLSHTEHHAMASVVLEGTPSHPG
ncbi:MAG TPA: holo-ACP synthase [Candidatus Udaeobacter sp.]|nr:holo-ACP synthase [Candidatus Udaeobacter sp.]